MNRRRAIFGFGLIGGGVLAFSSVYKYLTSTQKPDLDWMASKFKLLEAIADTFIPETETPGAKSVKAHDFLILAIKDCTNTMDQNSFINGLKDLEAHCEGKYSSSFIDCSDAEKLAVLNYFERKEESDFKIVKRVRRKILGDSFFHLLKMYLVVGYCTSELGATKGLAYDYIPGDYIACTPLRKQQRSWATK